MMVTPKQVQTWTGLKKEAISVTKSILITAKSVLTLINKDTHLHTSQPLYEELVTVLWVLEAVQERFQHKASNEAKAAKA